MADEDEETKGLGEEAELQRITAVANQIRSDLSAGNARGALMAGIKAFPPKVPLEAAKEAAAQAMLTVFSVIERAALEAVIKELDENDRATLMKYVFKVMSLQTEKKVYDICLAAHAKLVEAGGLGIIMKTFSDKNV